MDGPVTWPLSFPHLLAHGHGLRVFHEFLEQEFSQENLNFWLDCQKLRRLASQKEVRGSDAESSRNRRNTHTICKLVKRIYSCYFAATARQAINVDSDARAEAESDVLNPSASSFRSAEAQVFNLMKDDSYVRFLKSDLFAQEIKTQISKVAQRKDYGLFSWYKTSIKPRLSVSTRKPPAGHLDRPLVPDSPIASGSHISNSSYHHAKSGILEKHSGSQQSNVQMNSDKKEGKTTTFSGKENMPSNHATGSLLFDDFELPDSLWQLSDENEYEDFFSDLLSASQKYSDVAKCKDKGMRRRSNSHPSLADTIGQVTQALHPSPSLDHIMGGLSATPRSRKALSFRSPPPPLPPKAGRQARPLPPPAPAESAAKRTLRV